MADSRDALTALYQPRIRELAAQMRGDRRLSNPSVSVTCRSPVCGSTLTLDLNIEDEKIIAIGWKVRACTLGMASLSISRCACIGQSQAQIAAVEADLMHLLAGEDIRFHPPWDDLNLFVAAREFPSRFDSIRLPFRAIAEGLTSAPMGQI